MRVEEALQNGIGTPVVPKKELEEGTSMPDSSGACQDRQSTSQNVRMSERVQSPEGKGLVGQGQS